MVGIVDFFGGSKRRAALALLDRTLGALEVNPAYIDDGMRFAIYRWAQGAAAEVDAESRAIDEVMRRAAEMLSFCVIGADETESLWGTDARAAREARFNAVIDRGEDESFDARLIKLVLAKGIAAPDIRARVSLEEGD